MALTENQFFEQYWPTTPQYSSYLTYVELANRPVGKGLSKPSAADIARVEATNRNIARTDPRFGFPSAWQAYSAQQQAIALAQQQQEEIKRQQAAAEQAARALAAEQARIQAELQAEQQAITQKQQQEAAAIEIQLGREQAAALAEQETLKAQFETERQQTEKLIGEAEAETQRQQVAAKRESAVALNVGKQTSLARLREQQSEITPVRISQARRQRSMIGQPGVTSTRVSARPSIGGYGGTSAGRVNPTGLNI